MSDFFHLKENGTTVRTEIVAGLTTFCSMAYILIVAPSIVSGSGIEWGAVFIASIVSSIVGTLVMALYANVPFVLAPGLGMCSFLVVTVCGQMGFTWQQGLSIVFICGVVNIIITLTNIRKLIVTSIPKNLQYAISGGIGIFIAYVGIISAGLISFNGGTPVISSFADPGVLLFLFGIVLALILYIRNIKGSIVLTIIIVTLIGIPLGITATGNSISFIEAINQIPTTFGAIFTDQGLPSLFNGNNILQALVAILSFCLVDTFDTVGTFVGAGRKSKIFTDDELTTLESKGKLDRALVADACATSVGAIMGTSNVTTVVESTTGIESGGRTGLTGLVVICCMILCMFISGLISIIPASAYSAVLILVGILMISSFKEINWEDLCDAAPAFFAGIFMALCYNISYGIATGFIVHCIIKTATGKYKEVSKTMWAISFLFILMFISQAMI